MTPAGKAAEAVEQKEKLDKSHSFLSADLRTLMHDYFNRCKSSPPVITFSSSKPSPVLRSIQHR